MSSASAQTYWRDARRPTDKTPATGVPRNVVSELGTFESVDPAYWVNHGYAVAMADARGGFRSEGDIQHWNDVEAADGAETIDWIETCEWSNSRVGMAREFVAGERLRITVAGYNLTPVPVPGVKLLPAPDNVEVLRRAGARDRGDDAWASR